MSNELPISRFRISTNLIFGLGSGEKLGDEIKSIGLKKPAAVVDHGVADNLAVKKTLASVEKAGFPLAVFKNKFSEPTYDELESFRANVKKTACDGLIGIGGGSTIDMAKGLAALLTNKGDALSFRGFPTLENRPLPVIAIPTTSGSGSEVTFNAVFTDMKAKKKLGINSILNFPVCTIIDPLILLECPRSVTVSSGTDAMVHALESFVHRNHSQLSRLFSKEAFKYLFNNLAVVADKPKNTGARGHVALGAYLAAIALMNSGSGPAGAFSYPLGVHYNVPHGIAGAVFLPSIIRFNIDKGYDDYDQLYDLIDGVDQSLPKKEKNKKFGDELEMLWEKLKVPKSLSAFGVDKKGMEFMVAQYNVLTAAIAQNPIDITKEDVRLLLQSLS